MGQTQFARENTIRNTKKKKKTKIMNLINCLVAFQSITLNILIYKMELGVLLVLKIIIIIIIIKV